MRVYFSLFVVWVLCISACRFTSYSSTDHLGKSLLDFEGKKVLVLPLESNLRYNDQEFYSQALLGYLRRCPNTEVLDMTGFYNQYQIGFAVAKTLEDKISLMNEFTNIDFAILPYANIKASGLFVLDSDETKAGPASNSAFAGIKAYDVRAQQMIKYNEHSGRVDNSGSSDFDYEFYQSANKIVRKCYDKSLMDFLQYVKCL